MNNRKLTIDEANRIADGQVTVSVDPIDSTLWRVEDDEAVEAHEPMTEDAWRHFLTDYWAVLGSGPNPALVAVLRDNLSPEAVAAIVAHLQPVRTNDSKVDREVRWFAEELVKILGGDVQQARLAEELGL